MQERRRFLSRLELGLEFVLPIPDCDQLVLYVAAPNTLDDRLDDLLAPRLQLNQLALRGRLAGALLHPEAIHLLGELATELLEEVLPHQLLLERSQHAGLDFLTRDRELVRARPSVASAEASEVVTRVDDEPGAALAALGQTGEDVLRLAELVETPPFGRLRPLVLHLGVSRLHARPKFVVDDAQVRHVADDPLRFRVQPRDAFARVGILEEPLPVPDHAPDVQLVVKDAEPALRVAVDRARTPERSARPAQPVSVQVLRDLPWWCACEVLLEDASNYLGFFGYDLALAGRDDAVLESSDDPIAEADATARLAEFDTSAQSTPGLVRQLLQEHRVHRPLEADVEERDVALGERDDADAGECEALEQARGVFLVSAEAIERFREDDIDFLAQRRRHHRLEA